MGREGEGGQVGRDGRSPRGRPDRWTEVHRAALGRDPPISGSVHADWVHEGGEGVGARVAHTWLPRGSGGGRGAEIDGVGGAGSSTGAEPRRGKSTGAERGARRSEPSARIEERRRDGGRRWRYAAAGVAARGGSGGEGRSLRRCPEEVDSTI